MMCCVQVGELLRLLQLMAAVHGASMGGSKVWGSGVDSQLHTLSSSLRQQEQRMSTSQAAASPAEGISVVEPGPADGSASTKVTAAWSSEDDVASPLGVSSSGEAAATATDEALRVLAQSTPQRGETHSDDVWAEIEDKIRRQGAVVDGADSRVRQMRRSCLMLLKDMTAPPRGKKD